MAALSVEGLGVAAIARVVGRSWNTIARWLERAQSAAAHFNDRHVRGYELLELQADELHAAMPARGGETWVFTAIEVVCRLWASTLVGRRSSANTRALMNDGATRSKFIEIPLITTD